MATAIRESGLPSQPTPSITAAPGRVASVDLIRGAVMVLMAIDHVRVYSGLPAGGPTPGIFFTRWITHFCAPAFVFLAGTSAALYGRDTRTSPASSSFAGVARVPRAHGVARGLDLQLRFRALRDGGRVVVHWLVHDRAGRADQAAGQGDRRHRHRHHRRPQPARPALGRHRRLARRRSPLGPLEDHVRGLLRRSGAVRAERAEPHCAVFAHSVDRRDRGRLRVRADRDDGTGPPRPAVPAHWVRRDRAVRDPPRVQSVRRPGIVDGHDAAQA